MKTFFGTLLELTQSCPQIGTRSCHSILKLLLCATSLAVNRITVLKLVLRLSDGLSVAWVFRLSDGVSVAWVFRVSDGMRAIR